MTRRTAKTFVPGEAVEVKFVSDGEWRRGRYLRPAGTPGVHWVVNPVTDVGVEVPSRRIRKRSK